MSYVILEKDCDTLEAAQQEIVWWTRVGNKFNIELELINNKWHVRIVRIWAKEYWL